MANIWVLLVAAVVGLTVGGVAALIFKLKGKFHRMIAELTEEAASRGETVVIPPEYGSFRGAEREWGRVRCDGVACLTDRRLILAKLIGKRIEIPRDRIVGVSAEKTFLGNFRLGMVHVVVETADGNRIGFFFRDPAKWQDALGRST